MAKQKVHYTEHYPAVMERLTGMGLLVGSYDAAGKPNLMTIGWGSIGSIWGTPVWIILVRPSRHTYRCIEHTGCFTVNVLAAGMEKACAICGSRSGRDDDKFALAGLTAEKAQMVLAPAVAQSPLVYECQVIHSNDVAPAKLVDEILSSTYMDGDYHRVYYGKILAARAEPDAGRLIAGR